MPYRSLRKTLAVQTTTAVKLHYGCQSPITYRALREMPDTNLKSRRVGALLNGTVLMDIANMAAIEARTGRRLDTAVSKRTNPRIGLGVE
jgi:hypothetical protein